MMSKVRARDNRAEVLLRSILWRRGYRFRLQSKSLIGRPDIVFPRYRTVVFVDGDFWHGRALREGGDEALRGVIRGQRFDWWKIKLSRNVERDKEVEATLRRDGWKVVRVWESAVLRNPETAARRIERALRRHVSSRGD